MPSGVGVAVVCTLLASEPASGSVRAKAASFSPLTSGGSQRRFCSSVPNSSRARMPMLWWALTKTAVEAQWPPITSMILRVAELREAAAAVLLRRRHAEHAEPAQAGDDVRRDVGVAVDGGGVDVLLGEAAHLGDGLRPRRRCSSRLELGIGEEQRGVEVAEEQALGEAQRLRAGEEQFLGLLAVAARSARRSGP